ncbi:MAG TPA: hypothetical protein VES38_02500 [Methylotenera sp.]|nr:hypothetical protein [Methylotenera sp.]
MNKQTRKDLRTIINEIEALKASLEEIRDCEQSSYDNLPESLQGSERGDKFQYSIDYIESSIDGLIDVVDSINEAIE